MASASRLVPVVAGALPPLAVAAWRRARDGWHLRRMVTSPAK